MEWAKVVNQRTLERKRWAHGLRVWRSKLDDPNLLERCLRVGGWLNDRFRDAHPEWTVGRPSIFTNHEYGDLFIQDKYLLGFEWFVVTEPVRDCLKSTVQDFVDGKIKHNYLTVGDPADGR